MTGLFYYEVLAGKICVIISPLVIYISVFSLNFNSRKDEVVMEKRFLIEEKIQDEYKNFLEYCGDSGKIFVDELTETDFVAYRTKYAVSREEVEILKARLIPKQNESDLSTEKTEENFAPTLKEMFGVTDPEPYKNILISELSLNIRLQNHLKENHFQTLFELLNYSVPEILKMKNIGNGSVKNILDALENFFNHPLITQEKIFEQSTLLNEETLKNFAESMINAAIKKEKHRGVILGRAEGKTLKEVGRSLQITRQRVRQIENRVVEIFSERNPLRLKKFFDSLREQLGGKNFFMFEDLKNLIGENSAKILWFFILRIALDKKIFYLDAATNAIVLQEADQKQIDYDDLIKKLPEILHEDELNDEVNRMVKSENCSEELLNLHISQNYKRCGKFFFKGRVNLNFQFEYILRERFQSGYKIADETHYNRFVRCLREIFDYTNEFSQRALDARISSYIGVLCDRGKYMHPDFLHVPQKIILLINDYIEKSDRAVLLYKEIFTALKKDFVGTQITNHYILQGIIKYYGTPYELSKDCLIKNSDVNLAAEFNNFVEKNGEVSTPEIKAEFISFQDHNITMLSHRCSEVIYIGGGKYLHSTQLNLQENDFEAMEKFLTANCSDSPVSSRYLFNLFWEKFQDFLHRNKIEDHDKLFGILKYMFKEKFNFSRPYVSATDSTNITNKKVLLKYFETQNKIEIENLLNLCEEKGIRHIAKNFLIECLSPEFIRVDEFYLRRPESIGVTDEIIAVVVENVRLAMERNGGWQSAKTFPDFEWLPRLEVSWNGFLLESIVRISENDFKILRNPSTAGEFSTAIFLSEDFDEDNFDSFCLKVLSDEHKREPFQSKQEILNWLRENGLTNKKIPKILEGYINVDKQGKVFVQEI